MMAEAYRRRNSLVMLHAFFYCSAKFSQPLNHKGYLAPELLNPKEGTSNSRVTGHYFAMPREEHQMPEQRVAGFVKLQLHVI